MKKINKIIKTEWIVGIVVTLVVLGGYLMEWDPLYFLEYKAYDLRAAMVKTEPTAPIAIIAIDDVSIEEIGRWPWPRRYMAALIDLVSMYEPRVLGLCIFFTEPVLDPGLLEVSEIKQMIEKMPRYDSDPRLMQIYEELSMSEQRLNNDAILADSITVAGNVVLPMFFGVGEKMDNFDIEIPEFIDRHAISGTPDEYFYTGVDMVFPVEPFAVGAAGLGHDNIFADSDGSNRKSTLLIEYGGRLFPSFGLELVLEYLNYGPGDVEVGDNSISFGKISIPTDKGSDMFIKYRGGTNTFKYYSFVDVVSEAVPASEFKDKIVLVGLVGTGLGSLNVTPMGSGFPSVEILANIIDDILARDFISRPHWARYAEIAAIIIFGLFMAFILPRLKAFIAAIVAIVLLVLWNGACIFLFVSQGQWLMMLPPTIVLGVGYTLIVSMRFMVTEKRKEKVESDSIETNKMLGLSFQGQGMLDLALDKFMKCPIGEESIKEHMYNLALDFERKRQFNKAASIYKHIFTDGPFRDVEEKIARMTQLGETMIFGGAKLGGGKADGTVIVDGADMNPTLGRYQVVKELGKGAMGVVYLGRDPKINRQVAIKTVRFDEVDDTQIKEVKERFFREAEAAGKLSHPNIVTIYDAGEEHDLAYVAMELLDGMDLSDYIVKKKKVPPKMAIRWVAAVAEALDYAHKNGVVHRDIKPANIMLLKKGNIKVTDFGIARVMESSKTQTGVVLGTPSYMSPEQVVGKKVDGRSDLFSLGVMFYELLTGKKPFTGDSMATLMYNIANNPPLDIKEIDGTVPPCCEKIIGRILEKDVEKRYQRGLEIVKDLKACYKTLE